MASISMGVGVGAEVQGMAGAGAAGMGVGAEGTSVIRSAAPVAPGASGVARAWEHIPPFDDHSELVGAGAPKCSQSFPSLLA